MKKLMLVLMCIMPINLCSCSLINKGINTGIINPTNTQMYAELSCDIYLQYFQISRYEAQKALANIESIISFLNSAENSKLEFKLSDLIKNDIPTKSQLVVGFAVGMVDNYINNKLENKIENLSNKLVVYKALFVGVSNSLVKYLDSLGPASVAV